MVIRFDSSGTQKALIEHCHSIAAMDGIKSICILACDGNGFTPEAINRDIRQIQLPLFGGIFPGILHGKSHYNRGSIILGFSRQIKIHTITDLSSRHTGFETVIEKSIPDTADTRTMIVLVDGLAKRISGLIEGLFNNFGLEFNYIGGGAGSLSMIQRPCLFSNDGLVQDQAIIALLPSDSGVGVSHGWQSLIGPFQITESRQNVIVSMDFQPAFDVYRKAIQPHLKQEITPENFFSLAKNHPFGLAKLGTEKLVRDPIIVAPDGAIQCVGEVPEGSYAHILGGSVDSLVDAAKSAMNAACNQYPGEPDRLPSLFIDCISRVLYLERDFDKELEAVQRANAPLVGALTLGEIGCSGQDYLEFYNKTCVLGVVDL